MKKTKKSKLLIFIILSFSFLINKEVYAKEVTTGRVSATLGLRLRTEASSSSNSILTIPYNTIVTLNEYKESGNGCNDKWVNVIYSTNDTSYTGYVCSNYIEDITTKTIEENIEQDDKEKEENNNTSVSTMTDEEFEEYLTNQGFPDDYKVKLREIHKLHPTWIFKAVKAKYTWAQALKEENNPGNSFLNINPTLKAKGYEGYLSTNSGDYNYETDTFIAHDGIYWFQARSETVEYYMDPRKYLDEKTIFAFEDLLYYPEYQTLEAVNKILLTDFMKQFGTFFIAAAERYNVSPVYLAALSRQEVGTTNQNIVTNGKAGVLSDGVDYTGYYNFFNIGASSSGDPKLKSLQKAKQENWTSEEKSIIEGSYFISVYYIACGQYTSYFQKFNVANTATKGIWHQYTTNLDALTSPAISTYNSYNARGLIDEAFTFSIPVFEGLPKETHLPNLGNPNNYLKTLKVNNMTVTNFQGSTLEYTVTVPYSESVNIDGETVNSLSKVEGLGTIKIDQRETTVNIKVTAQNGEERTYKLLIIREDKQNDDIKQNEEINEEKIDSNETDKNEENNNKDETPKITINDVISSTTYKMKDTFMTNVTLGSSVETLINNLTNTYKTISINIKNRNNEAKTSGTIATGDKVIIETGTDTVTLDIVIYGDINGDGNISAIDLLNIQKSILGYTTLQGAYQKSADINKDGKISAIDLLNIQKHILKYIVISQD